jgi:hypothetical protein
MVAQPAIAPAAPASPAASAAEWPALWSLPAASRTDADTVY